MTDFTVYEIFKHFGPITAYENNRQTVRISFIKTANVIELKSNRKHKHEDVTFVLKWREGEPFARSIIDVDKSLHPAPDQQSPDNILNALNDDCLRMIFDSEQFDLWDLCSIANVCKRFKSIVQRKINLKFGDEPFDTASLYKYNKMLCRVEEYIQSVGSKCTSISLPYPHVVSGMCAKYCKNITELRCSLFHCKAAALELRPLLFKLHKLDLNFRENDQGTNWDLNKLFTADALVEEMMLEGSRFIRPEVTLPTVNLPKLKQLRLSRIVLNDTETTTKFFSHNQQLKKLSLYKTNTNCNIFKYCPNVEELILTRGCHIKCDDEAEFTLGNLKKLGVFVTDTDQVESFMTKLGAIAKSLQTLSIRHTPANICQFASIKELQIEECDDKELFCIAKRLIHLEFIYVISSKVTILGVHNFLQNCGENCRKAIFRLNISPMQFDPLEDVTIDQLQNIGERRQIQINIGMDIGICNHGVSLFPNLLLHLKQ